MICIRVGITKSCWHWLIHNRGFIISHLSSSGDAGQGIASLVVAIISLSARLRAMHVKDVVEQGSGGLQDRS